MADLDLDLATAEYQVAMHRVVLAAKCLEGEPLAKMLATIERAHSIGHILYPGDYRTAVQTGSLAAQQRMLEVARQFVATLQDVREKCS